jgi:outer membrane protein TolC
MNRRCSKEVAGLSQSRSVVVALATILGLAPAPPAAAATVALSLEDAMRLAARRSVEARRIGLEEQRAMALYRAARTALRPDVGLDVVVPEFVQHFDVAPLPSTPIDSAGTPLLVYGKTTTTSRNGVGSLRMRQLLPWKGALSADGEVFYRNEDTSPVGVRESRDDYTVQAAVGLDVRLLGDDAARRVLRHTDLDWAQAQARSRSARAQLDFETTTKYLALMRAQLALEVARTEADQASQAQEVARRKVGSGLLAEVDEMRLDVFRAERVSRVASVETDIGRALDELSLQLGLAATDSLQLTENLQPFVLQEPIEQWVQRAVANREEIGLLEREVALLEQDRRARRPWWPEAALALRYGGGASDPSFDRAVSQLTSNDLSLRLGVHLPLWDSGLRSREDDAAQAEIGLRQLDAESVRDRITIETRDAVRAVQEAGRRYGILAQSSRLAADVLRITYERYGRGLVDTQTYLGAQSDAAAARLGELGALLDLYQSRARLRLVVMDGAW